MSDSETSGNNYKYTYNIKNKTKVIGVCVNLWNIWFQHNANGTTGEKNVAHKKPNQRATWIKYGVLGWYIGPWLEQYRRNKVFVTEKRSEKIDDVVKLPPSKF